MKNYYKILGLEKGASPGEIKRAYRRLAMRYHPDRNAEPRAAQAFILVNEAYEFLSDPGRRASYSRPKTGRERDDERRKARYEDWEAYQKEAARRRAKAYAKGMVEEFERSPM
ncbi:MAG: DnaJ domain-containing protein, partial [Flavobacteriales bacterium]|nr:DnaJ domain-containing protein [Flavobacteriales bacterium]